MIEIVVPIIIGAIAIGSVWLIYYLNHRTKVQGREQNELPKIQLYRYADAIHVDCYFRLETDHHSIGWKVIRVEVVDSNYRECLKQNVHSKTDDGRPTWSPGEWQDFCDYPEGASCAEPISFHHACWQASLLFICETPEQIRIWWKPWRKEKKKIRLPYKYVKGAQPPVSNDWLLRQFIGDGP